MAKYLYSMKIVITESQLKKVIEESYKITPQDKKEIEDELRDDYRRYLEKYKSTLLTVNSWKKLAENEKAVMGNEPSDMYNKCVETYTHYKNYFNSLKSDKYDGPILYNKFYKDNYETVKQKVIQWNSGKVHNANIPEGKRLNQEDVDNYLESLKGNEYNSVIKFLDEVSIRVNSGTGEATGKPRVNRLFFATPPAFQKMFSVKPSKFMWRGDDFHPCDEEYDNEDEYAYAMQSFSIHKNVGFGSIEFPATKIKSYGGSFSIPLFLEYNRTFNTDFGDDEGEVMFFNVTYQCNKTFTTWPEERVKKKWGHMSKFLK